jgi:hypothetical protein
MFRGTSGDSLLEANRAPREDCAHRSKFPHADDEYTPAQRRVIDARLDESEEDLKKGHTAGPFQAAGEMVAHMKAELKKQTAVKKPKRSR